jgi:hypothetical protein
MRYLLVVALLLGCGNKAAQTPAAPTPVAEALTQTSESGPVKVTVALSPKAPRLGDPLTLTLTVAAQAKVAVEMPPFGEALGRFSITSFTPRSETAADGSVIQIQRYVLEAPMSGRQRIPALRVEFTDGRPGQAPDGGEATHEILTDELAVDIASVLPAGEVGTELRGLRGPLAENPVSSRGFRLALVPLLLLLGAGAWWLLRNLRRRARLRVKISAYDVAMQRLSSLQSRGWPKHEQADAWYVELSDIVRRYIEDRYGVRAPDLTTEEFLREARQQLRLQQAHRDLLESFLSTCDRVKFAGYRPGEPESQQAHKAAQRFIDDTRVVQTGAAPAAPAAPEPPAPPEVQP